MIMLQAKYITGPCSDAGNDWPLRWEVRSGVYKKQFLLKASIFSVFSTVNCEATVRQRSERTSCLRFL
jgi:hypothetical protein